LCLPTDSGENWHRDCLLFAFLCALLGFRAGRAGAALQADFAVLVTDTLKTIPLGIHTPVT
jgi:hypothetical protein